MGKTSTASKQKYNEKAYDRVALSVKKAQSRCYRTLQSQKAKALTDISRTLCRSSTRTIQERK